MTGLSIIVNADDLGLSDAVNREVERLHQAGVLSSATVMATGPAVEEVPAIQERNPQLGLGIHLNATNFQALTPAIQKSELCDSKGVFHLDFRSRHRRSLNALLVKEWMAQLERLWSFGIQVDHLDSHHHVHTWPSVLLALREVSRQSGIQWVRNTRNVVPAHEKSGLRQRVKYAGKWGWSRAIQSMGMLTTRGFCSVADAIALTRLNDFPVGLEVVELMCHPGDFGNPEYVEEVHWLESEFEDWLEKRGRLVRFADLETGSGRMQ